MLTPDEARRITANIAKLPHFKPPHAVIKISNHRDRRWAVLNDHRHKSGAFFLVAWGDLRHRAQAGSGGIGAKELLHSGAQKRFVAQLQTRPRENDRFMTRQLAWRSSRSGFIGKPGFDQRLIGNIPFVSRNLNALKKCHGQA